MAVVVVGSPSMRISQLQDKSIISSICKPFIQQEINAESFCYNFVSNNILPEVVSHIKNVNTTTFDLIPKITKLIIDNFGQEGLDLVLDKILTEILAALKNAGDNYAATYMQLYIDTLSAVSSQYRDEVTTKLIQKFSSSLDIQERILAANLIPIVRDPSLVQSYFRALALDRVASIRIAILDILKKSKFDEGLIRYVLMNSLNDKDEDVRLRAACIFASVCPKNIEDFNEILLRPDIGRCAISGIPAMAKVHGISSIFYAMSKILLKYPNECSLALLDISKFVTLETEEYLITMAQELIRYTPFVWHLHEFSQKFQNREPFLQLLSPNKAKDWRLRYALQKQIILFASEFQQRLIPYAMRFSGDLVASIRDGSVHVWRTMLDVAPNESIAKILWLSGCGWRQRLIVAKIITADQPIREEFMETARKLASDKVANIRYCFASRIYGTKLFDELYSGTSDPEILHLIESKTKLIVLL